MAESAAPEYANHKSPLISGKTHSATKRLFVRFQEAELWHWRVESFITAYGTKS